MKKTIGAFVIFTGLCLLFFVFYGQWSSISIQEQMKNTILARRDEEITESLLSITHLDTIKKTAQIVNEPSDVMEALSKTGKEKSEKKNTKNGEKEQVINNALAILSIPSIDLEVAVSEGLSDSNLKYSVAHYATSTAFGELGNACVVGHRSHPYNRFFYRLDDVAIGDIITLNTGVNAFTYQVQDVFIVEPKDIWVLEQHSEFVELTLITCTPIRKPTHRLIIKATGV